MLRKLNGRPAWYQALTITAALAAIFVLVRWFFAEMRAVDYALMASVHAWVLFDLFLVPGSAPQMMRQRTEPAPAATPARDRHPTR